MWSRSTGPRIVVIGFRTSAARRSWGPPAFNGRKPRFLAVIRKEGRFSALLMSGTLVVMGRASVIIACVAFVLHGGPKRPEFQDYATQDSLLGTAAEPRLTTPWSQKFRTRIRRGTDSQEGFRRGSDYVETPGPNFAGHYRVVNWGCGSGCLMMVVVDLKTGSIYRSPMSLGPTGEDLLIIPNLGMGWGDFDFRQDSRLFVMKSCPWGSPDPKSPLYRGSRFCGTSYFVMGPTGFRMIQRVAEELLPPVE
jgi:hypothetical protein